MGKLYILMGKSATGKDTLFRYLIEDRCLDLKTVVGYTTRPLRTGEQDGFEYYFVSMEKMKKLEESGRMIEKRVYHTVYGDWYYFTVDDGQIDFAEGSYLLIATLEAYQKIRLYFGEGKVVPLYIEVEDGERLRRAIAREELTGAPKFAEMCRRYLADDKDFSEENLAAAGIGTKYQNISMEDCLDALRRKILADKRAEG